MGRFRSECAGPEAAEGLLQRKRELGYQGKPDKTEKLEQNSWWRGLCGEDELHTGDEEDDCEHGGNGSDLELARAELGTDGAAEDGRKREREGEGWDGISAGEMTDEGGGGVYQNEWGGDGSGSFCEGPTAKENERREEDSAAGSCQAGKEADGGANADGDGNFWRRDGRRFAVTSEESKRREEKDGAEERLKNSGGQMKVTADKCSGNG